MNIISVDYEKKILKSDYYTWEIISNNDNKTLLLQREENGVFHAAEADIKKKDLWEVVDEISYRGPNGDMFFFDEETGISKL